MKFISSLYFFLNKIFLLIPLTLFLFSFSSPLRFGLSPQGHIIDTPEYALWKACLHLSLLFFEISFLVVLLFWLTQKNKNIKTFLKAFQNWLIGLLLTIFSFALAGLVIDLGWLVYFIFLSISK